MLGSRGRGEGVDPRSWVWDEMRWMDGWECRNFGMGGEREDNRCASRVNARVSFFSSSGGAVLCNAAAAYAPSQGCVCPVVCRVGIPGLASLGASGSLLGRWVLDRWVMDVCDGCM